MDTAATATSSMGTSLGSAVLLWAIVASGINSGSFFAFSNFVMASLARLPPHEGLRAMQEINRGAPNVGFMATLMGGAVAGIALVVMAPGEPGAGWQAAGGSLAALSAAITIVFHVPRNDALDRVDTADPTAARQWRTYVREWTRGNHVRTLTSTGAVVCLTIALATAWGSTPS